MYLLTEKLRVISEDLKELRYQNKQNITEIFLNENADGGQIEKCPKDGWKKFQSGGIWGGYDKHMWFKTTVEMLPENEGKTVVFGVFTGKEGQWDAKNPQFYAYVNGKIIQGMDVNHTEFVLTKNAKRNEVFEIVLYAYSGMNEDTANFKCYTANFDENINALYYDIFVPLSVAKFLDKEDKRRVDILEYLNNTANILDTREIPSADFDKSVKDALCYIETEFYGKYCGNSDVTAKCVGHTHIDVAWLWTLAQTREKTVRSFSTVLNLMKQYPEYVFMSSQPQLYQYLKEENPALYGEIKERVKEGRWEAEGAMWLEADCNLTSGESLVRQILFGKRFFKEEFNKDNKILWLPDVFGYSAALPQILKKSGVDYFMTTKISWSEYDKMPYDTFMWEGIDGTKILTYFITTRDCDVPDSQHFTTYVGKMTPSEVMGSWKRFQQKDVSDEVLICYGYGDGGGGTTPEMVETAKRLSKGIPGCPKVEFSTSLDFFKDLEKKVENAKRMPEWVGELYLELHRGTYTSMARNKKYNRKSEFALMDAELYSVMDKTVLNGEYRQAEINDMWRTVLLNQFHDILPGSSIKEVYEVSKEQYENVLSGADSIKKNALSNIAKNINAPSDGFAVFNQLGFTRSELVEIDNADNFENPVVTASDGTVSNAQKVGDKLLFYAENVPSKGYKTYTVAEGKPAESEIFVSEHRMSNRFFDIEIDKNGNISSIYDKRAERNVLKGTGNVFQAFEDKPKDYDAWEISVYYQQKMWEVNDFCGAEVIENGTERGVLRIKRKFVNSEIVQDICIYKNLDRIDFKTKIDWKEKHVLLKTAFPVDVHTNKATYEIQFGNVERPTHWNTSWDMAKFEVCAQKWADISEDGYGVSLLNDCKYGHDIKDGVMRLTLIKSATYPNPDADKELHEFTYSLYPHKDTWREANTVDTAYSLNCPLTCAPAMKNSGTLPCEFSFIETDCKNVVVETVKKAEDSGDIIVRMFECQNRRGKVNAVMFKDILNAAECDLLENETEKVQFDKNTFTFEIKPYEIKTFKIKL